eukprot:7798081-Prorocentrum_lima.AAC.1
MSRRGVTHFPTGQPDGGVGGVPQGVPLAQAPHFNSAPVGLNQVLARREETPTSGRASTTALHMQWDV